MTDLAPGIHAGVPFSVYCSWDAAHFSSLKWFDRSALHAREQMQAPPREARFLDLGQGAHTAILEPELLEVRYIRGPKGDARLKPHKDKLKALRLEYPEHTILRAEDYDTALALRDEVWEHPIASELLKGPGVNEVSMVWEDQATGLLCKGRIDRYTEHAGYPVAIDLKTAADASPAGFARASAKFSYAAQAAHYLNGLLTLHPMERRWYNLAIETRPPYAVAVYEYDLPSLDYGRRKVERWLSMFAAALKTNQWPGYPEAINTLSLPGWVFRDEEYDDAEF